MYGGIPISETMEEYNQEILGNFDLSLIFSKKNDHYYEFIKEIENKESLSKFINVSDNKIIKLIERWWDKYQVPLKLLEQETNELENEFKNSLKKIYGEN